MYAVVVSFIEPATPAEGIVSVAARDLEHAKQIVQEQYANRQDLKIVDAYAYDDVQMPKIPDEEAEAPKHPIPAELLKPQLN